MVHTAIMLNGHINLIFLHTYAKTQPKAMSTTYAIAEYAWPIRHKSQIFDHHMRKIVHVYVTGHTGMLGEPVVSHTKVAIYPTYAICCKSL